MNPKVEQWLKEQQEKENKQKEIEKNNLLVKLGLYEESTKEEDGSKYDFNLKKYIKTIDVTDDDYDKIKKYACNYTKPKKAEQTYKPENNGEKALRCIALIILILTILSAFIAFICTILWHGSVDSLMALLLATIMVIYGLITYWIVKVGTNISLKSTEIRDLLKKK